MKVTYLAGPATRTGEVVQILEMQDDEEGVIVRWGSHRYTFKVKRLNNTIHYWEHGRWKVGWHRTSLRGFHNPEQFQVRIT